MRLTNSVQWSGLRGGILLALVLALGARNASAQALTITTTTLPDGVQGTPYSQPLTASGGTGTYTWSIASGTLPAGLTLTGAVISGTPTGSGSTFTVQVNDGMNTAQQSLTITVNAVLTITTATPMPGGISGTPYSQTLTATGGTGSKTWSLASGSLPTGLTLSAGGVISGTPSGSGTTFTAQVTDGVQATTKSLTINISAVLTITTATPMPTGTPGVPYSQTLTATGGTGSNTWSLASGSLPTGLSLSTGGVISGTPSGSGTTFTAQVTDGVQTATKSLTINVSGVLTITTATPMPTGTPGVPYSQTLTATGGTGSNTWSLASGSLPTGLSLSTGGVISGTPSGSGTTFTAQVTDGVQTATKSLTINISGVLTITTTSPLPNGVQGTAYSHTLTATGGTGSNTWSLASGSLPAGLGLSAAGVISGTPTATGSTFTAQVTDGVQTATKSLTINVSGVLTITTATPMPTGTPGVPYSQTLTAAGGTGSNTWSLASGSLPTGLSLSTGGVISGTPSGSGTTFTAQVTDGVQTATKSLTINISGVLTITTATPMPTGTPGVPYSQTLTATGGTGSNTWSLAGGSLPTGLSLSAGGVISGTPSGSGTTFTAQVTDGAQTATKSLTINISGVLTITTTSPLPNGVQGTAYSHTLTATGGTGSNTWSLASGSLPAGLGLSAAGVISGTPTATGSTFTVQVTDGVQTATKSLTINVSGVLTITTTSPLPNGVQGTAYSHTLTATGGTGSNTWSLASGSLPAGLGLSAAGVISGTPTATGSTFTVQVTDGVQTTTKSLTLTINAVLTITTTSPLPNGVQGTAYSHTLTATGGTGSNTWSLASGSLPAGLGLSAAGVISGTPTATGSTFTVQVTDGVQTTTKSLTLTINAVLTITTTSPLPNGVQGTAYSHTLTATGGTGSNTWSLASGSLPAGLGLSAAGVISGTPTATGSTFTVQVTDGVQTITKSLTLTINAVLTITTTSPLPNGVQGTAYSHTLTATGGTGSNTWSLASGSLPAGLGLSAAGVISGTPTATGSTFTVQVTDGVQTTTKSLTLTVNAVLTITTASLPNGVQGTAYSQTLTATGGTGSNTWSLASGTLPAGLALSAAGVISGTPTGTGASSFTVQVTDGVQTKQQALTITVNAVLAITTATPMPNGVQGTAYSQTLTATGGTGSNTWSLASGTLPAGLSLSAAGVISGTPTGTGASSFTVQVTDGIQTKQKALTITVNVVLAITTTSLPNGVITTAYSQTLAATGGTGSNTWSLASGTLPGGLALSAAGVISGTPTGTGASPFTVQVTDGVQTKQQALTITVNAVLAITTTSLPNGAPSVPYSQTLTATGGTGSYTWSLATGSLPTGLTLSAAGVISGTPTGSGSTFTVQVTDGIQTKQQALTITISTVLTISTTSLTNGVQGTALSRTLAATGGTGTYTWSLASGTLPTGLALSAAGVISGTPTGTGPSTFTVQVTDGVQTKQQALTLTINAVLTITTTTLPNADPGVAYSQTLAATGGTGTNTWSLSTGTLPTGLTLSAAGVISGTPSGSGTTFTVQVTDGIQTKTQSLTITVNAVLTITTTTLPNGVVGTAYSQTLTATGGAGTNTWSLATGTLPTGLALSAAGVISGTPSGSPGPSPITVQVTDGAQTVQKALTLTVNAVLAITTTSLPNGVQGTAYSQTLAVTGGSGTNTWSLTSGTLPTGLALSAAGVISGTPSASGASTFTVQVDDTVQTKQQALTITINTVLTITTTSLPTGVQGTSYSQTLTATGGLGTNTWSLATGTLPTGLTLSAAGVISGTPTATGSTFTVQVTDGVQTATKSLTLNVVLPLTITTASLPTGGVGAAYSVTLAATGGTNAYTWSIETGTLPGGLNLNPATGLINGTPTSSTGGPVTLGLKAADNNVVGLSVTKNLALTVVTAIAVTTASPLPQGAPTIPYSQQLAATGGTGTYTWSLASGTVPNGLALNAAGLISGTPSAAGSSTFTVQATDTTVTGLIRQMSFTLVIVSGITITNPTLSNGVPGAAYSENMLATGGTSVYTWSIASGSLPAGLTLSAAGVISGTPTTVGTSNVTIRATDSTIAALTVTKGFTLAIVNSLTVTTSASLPGGVRTVAYSQTLTAAGGTAPFTWLITSGSLPAGLTLNSGTISGTPTASGTSTFTVRATDSGGPVQNATKVLTLIIVDPLAISTASALPTGVKDGAYSQILSATGGTGPYTWSIASGTLPQVLILNSSGSIGGLPTTIGSSNFTISVTDNSVPPLTVQKAFTLEVVGALTITTGTPLPSAFAGFAYSQTMSATGGKTPYTWSLATGTLPTGMTLNPTTGVLGGTAAAAAVSNFTVRVTDSDSPPKTVTQAMTLAILTPPGSGSAPTISLNGLQIKVDPAQQMPLSLKLSSTYAAAIQGTITLNVTPAAGIPAGAYSAVQFSTGGSTVSFTIPANATDAVFPAGSSALLLVTGTVTGTITFTGSIQNGPANIALTSTTVDSTAPKITTLTATRLTGGLRVQIIGFSPERKVTEVQFSFDVRVNGVLQKVDLTKAVDSDFGTWYQSAPSLPFGSAFKLDQIFTVTGSTAAVEAVTITLKNTQGQTTSSSVQFTN